MVSEFLGEFLASSEIPFRVGFLRWLRMILRGLSGFGFEGSLLSPRTLTLLFVTSLLLLHHMPFIMGLAGTSLSICMSAQPNIYHLGRLFFQVTSNPALEPSRSLFTIGFRMFITSRRSTQSQQDFIGFLMMHWGPLLPMVDIFYTWANLRSC